MSALSDLQQQLNDGLTKLQSDITAKFAELEAKIAAGSVTPADIAAFKASLAAIGTIDSQVNAEGTVPPPVA